MLVVAGGPAEPTELLSTTHDTGPCRPPARPQVGGNFFSLRFQYVPAGCLLLSFSSTHSDLFAELLNPHRSHYANYMNCLCTNA